MKNLFSIWRLVQTTWRRCVRYLFSKKQAYRDLILFVKAEGPLRVVNGPLIAVINLWRNIGWRVEFEDWEGLTEEDKKKIILHQEEKDRGRIRIEVVVWTQANRSASG